MGRVERAPFACSSGAASCCWSQLTRGKASQMVEEHHGARFGLTGAEIERVRTLDPTIEAGAPHVTMQLTPLHHNSWYTLISPRRAARAA